MGETVFAVIDVSDAKKKGWLAGALVGGCAVRAIESIESDHNLFVALSRGAQLVHRSLPAHVNQ